MPTRGKKKMSSADMKKNAATKAYRQGKGRIKESSSAKRSARGVAKGLGTKGEGKVAGSAGTRNAGADYSYSGKKTGSTSRVVREKGASAIKKKGVSKKGASKLKNTGRLLKSKSGGIKGSTTRKKVKTASAMKKKKK